MTTSVECWPTVWGTFWANDLEPQGTCDRCGKVLYPGWCGNQKWDGARKVRVCYACLEDWED